MSKKIIIILSILLLIVIILGGYYIYDNNKIVSTITMDINPSIKLNLNKKNKVINVIALNSDAQKIVSEDLNGKDLNLVVKKITEKVIENGYVEDEEVVILLNTNGNVKKENIEEMVEANFSSKKVECSIIVQEINEKSDINAKKYDISESKVSFIEEIIKENNNLKFEDLKDKSIKELKNIKEDTQEDLNGENNVDVPINKEEPIIQRPVIEEANDDSNHPPIITGVDNPPSDIYDTSGVWCTYNKTRPQNSTYQYDKIMNTREAHDTILSYLGLQQIDVIGDYGSQKEEKRSSYCIAMYYIITTREYRKTVVLDSVTGKIIDETSEGVPSPKISEDEAVDIFLNHFKLKKEDCRIYSASYGTDMEGSPNFVYRYSMGLVMNDGTQHVGSINALTGEIYSIAY